VKASKGNNKKNRTTGKCRNSRKQLLPALMAVGGACSMMAVSASALELGELKVNSTLGQPLRASIAYALNPHEELYNYCVYLRPGLAANGLPSVSKATISIADGMILLAGNRVIREPLLTMQVSVACPYTAHLTRQYTLMIDPAQPVAEAPVADAPVVVESSAASRSVAVTSTAVAEVSKPRPRVGRSRTTNRSPRRFTVGNCLAHIRSFDRTMAGRRPDICRKPGRVCQR
jgi:Tfp pilus assembly protein FimV